MRLTSRLFAIGALVALVLALPAISLAPTSPTTSFGQRMVALDNLHTRLTGGLLHAQGYSFNNPRAVWIDPGSCIGAVSGNGTGTQGLTTAGASFTPVMQAQTSATGTNTHTYVCNIFPGPVAVTGGTTNIIAINDAVFFYGVQTTGLGTQVATLASGTMNSATVFSTISYPTPGASETPSTVTPVRADAGSLTITPAVASFNVATTTAGAFFSAKFTPATPIAVKTDLQQILLTVALLNTATSATITNTPGVLVHIIGQ